MSREQHRGHIKDCFRAHMRRRFNWRSLKNGLHRGVPRPLFVPVIAMIRGSGVQSSSYLISLGEVWLGEQEVPPPPNPGSVSQAKSLLDKLSSRVSRRPVVTVLSYFTSRVINHPVLAPHPLPIVFPHHRAILLHTDT